MLSIVGPSRPGWLSHRIGLLRKVPIRRPKTWLSASILGVGLVSLMACVMAAVPGSAAAPNIMVFAATTLKNALDDAAALYHTRYKTDVTLVYGPSPALVKQIENGAPADLFISADPDWMDAAQQRGLIRTATRINLLSSRLVLIAPKLASVATAIKPGFPIAKLLGNGRLAMCDPMMMPAGRYGRDALERLGVWQSVRDRVANAADVRAALAYVSRGEAPLGIVFDTDAALDPGVRVVGIFPPDTHPPIIYPVAMTASSAAPDAKRFMDFLQSPAAGAIFAKYGYRFLPGSKTLK